MNQLKCMGEKCPKYIEHEFKGSYFMCWLDGRSYIKDSFQNRKCNIHEVIKETYNELESLKELANIIKEKNKC
jgi:hypothetical protein